MDLKSQYVQYAVQASLAITATASVYLIDTSRPLTLLVLLQIPLLYAYTAYISEDDFQTSSLISLAALAFVPLGTVFAAVAVLTTSGNILVSVLSRGTGFRDFYATASLPLLFAGLAVGLTVFASFAASPEEADRFAEEASTFMADRTGEMMNRTGLQPGQQQEQLVATISTVTVTTTHAYVLNRTELSPQDMENVSQAFEDAEEDVPEMIMGEASDTTPDIQEITERVVDLLMTGNTQLLLVPVIALLVYALHPVAGLLMAFIGVGLRRVDGYLRETGESEF